MLQMPRAAAELEERVERSDNGEIPALREQVRALESRLAALESASSGAAQGRFAPVYQAFEDRFRGSEDDIRRRLEVYLPDVERVTTGRPVLDVGPGRGEWLALLAERGVPAYGVEANPHLATQLRDARGLDVVTGDAVAHLEGLEPGGLDLVTAFHVVEHVDTDTLLGLLAAARTALRPGGALLIETPNPTNLVMGACNFYLDPTHERPMPPALTEFFVQASGFVDVEVRPLHPKEDADLTGLRLDGVDPRAGDLVAAALTKGLFGPQDYAVLGFVPTP
jgi:SAM-dependent methyltransferase